MNITSLRLTKKTLSRMPVKDRTLLLLVGNISNEINVLQKLLMMVRKKDVDSRVIDIVEAGQALIFMRMLIGKLHEAHVLVAKRVNSDERFGRNADWAGKEQLKRANKHFNKWGALISSVRNKLSFHSWDQDGLVEKTFAEIPEDEPWDFYLTGMVANSFYYASEMVVTRSMIGLTGVAKAAPTGINVEAAGLAEVFDAALDGANLLAQLFQVLMVEIIDQSVDESLETEELDIGQPPQMSQFHLPFFFDEDDLRQLRSSEQVEVAGSH